MINIIISSDPRYNINRNLIRATVVEALAKHRVAGKLEIGINIVGDRKMHELNRQFRGVDSSTDILSFALEDPHPSYLQHIPKIGFVASPDRVLRLGDIVLSYPQMIEDASLDGVSVDEEIRTLVEHGISHLLGTQHADVLS